MGDYTYRTREEVAEWRERCPIRRFRENLIASGQAPEAEFDAIVEEIREEVARALKAAESAPWPEPNAATNHVYSKSVERTAPEPGPGSDRELSYIAATLEALDYEMAVNPRIFVFGEGIGKRGGNFATTTGLFDKYGAERLCDAPIAERGFVGMGGGAAMTGTRPIIDFMFIDFINDAFGEIINQIAKMQYMSSGRLKMPILLRGCIGIGHSAATHHSGSYYSIFSHIPGLRVVVPSTPYDAKGLFTHALRSDDPVLFLEPRELFSSKGPVPADSYEIPFGKARVLRNGQHMTVVGIGVMAQRALAAATRLAEEGISAEVIDPRTVSPLDTGSVLASVRKTGRLLVVDEAFSPCSIASEIAAVVADSGFDDLDAPIRRLNGAFAPTPYSPTLEAAVTISPEAIAEAARDLMKE
jgi:2-oxoisovalerate dehydrogenase E1 component